MTRLQRWSSIFIVLLALGVRLWMLDYKPAHFDEGVNGHFVDEMRTSGHYAYEPENYHGPLHFYALFVSQQLLGRNLWALRLPTVLLGTGVVILLLAFRRFLPFRAVALAALFAAVSPAMIFFARYAIHEMGLPFFALLATYGGLALARGERRRCDLWCLAMGITGMILTKETYILHFIAALLALAVAGLINLSTRTRAVSRRPRPADLFTGPQDASEIVESPESLPEDTIQPRDVLAAWGTGLALIIAFYSGFGFAWDSLGGIFTTFASMQEKATMEGDHNKEIFYWIKLMASYEWPALVGMFAAVFIALPRSIWLGALFVVGGVVLLCMDLKDHPDLSWGTPAPDAKAEPAGLPAKNSLPVGPERPEDFLWPVLRLTDRGVFGAVTILLGLGFFLAKPDPHAAVRWLALYGLASLAAYSLIPYKTPWCSINFLWPFLLVLGCTLDRLMRTVSVPATALIAALLFSANLPDAWRLNFVNPVNDAVPPLENDRYAYVQTTWDIRDLLDPLGKLIAQDPQNRLLSGLIFGDAHPLHWYLNEMPNVEFRPIDPRDQASRPREGIAEISIDKQSLRLVRSPLAAHDAAFLIVPMDRADEVEATLTTRYYRSAYQPHGSGNESWLYLEATRFAPVLKPDRIPEFIPDRPPAGVTP